MVPNSGTSKELSNKESQKEELGAQEMISDQRCVGSEPEGIWSLEIV